MGENFARTFLFYNLAVAHYAHAFPTIVYDQIGAPTPHEHTRSLGSIVAWCFATIIACAWISVKPNKPGASTTGFKSIVRSFGIMAVLVIAPEFVIMWASRQYYSAIKISKRHEGTCCEFLVFWSNRMLYYYYTARGWTRVHAFFVIMGGFSLHDSNGDIIRTLNIEELQQLESEGKISWPTTTKEEILKLQTGGKITLLKIIAGFEIACFILGTIIARATQHLVIAQVEIMTFALTVTTLGSLTFLWWHKPCSIKSSVPVLMKKGPNEEIKLQSQSQPSTRTEEINSMPTASQDIPKDNESPVQTPISRFLPGILHFFATSPKWLLINPHKLGSLFHQHSVGSALMHIGIDLVRIPFFVMYQPIKHFFLILRKMVTCTDMNSTFYAPKLKKDENNGLVYAMGILAASLYGEIYLLTWTFQPSSYANLWRWRMGWVLTAAAIAPMASFAVTVMTGYLHGSNAKSKSSWKAVTIAVTIIFTYFLANIFIGSRMALIKHAVVDISSLPTEAYASVDWASVLASVTYT